MLHHERLKLPARDYLADEYSVIAKAFCPKFLAQLETTLVLGDGCWHAPAALRTQLYT